MEYHGYCYASMDYLQCSASATAGSCPKKCQDYFMELPSGWELVPYSASVVREVVAKYYFGTSVVLFSNGHSYWTKDNSPGSLYRKTNKLSRNGNSYKATGCSLKVLMRMRLGKFIRNNCYKATFTLFIVKIIFTSIVIRCLL